MAWGPPAANFSYLEAVLFDRDGTLVEDVPYNGEPSLVRVVDGAANAIRRLRVRGVRVAAVTNQSGVALGLIDRFQVAAVNQRVDELLGPLDAWFCCFHGRDSRCACRKPAPGLVLQAVAALGVVAGRCAVVGDRGADMEAAARAGAFGVLVPTSATSAADLRSAFIVASTIGEAADLLLGMH